MTQQFYNIVCISTIDWDFVWQGHQEIMSTLAREGHRVLFIENTGVRNVTLHDLPRLKARLLNWRKGIKGIRKVMENLYVYSPLVLPFPYSRLACRINKYLMRWTLWGWTKAMRFDNPIVWTWLPTALAQELIRDLNAQLVIYYCCDNFEATSSESRGIREPENALIRNADLVFAHSKALFDRCKPFTDQVYLFPYGFNREVFRRPYDSLPSDSTSFKRPILGFVGGVRKVIDFDLVEKVALAHQDKSLVFVGPLQTDVSRLARLPNVHFLGQKRYEEVPAYINCFDLCLIPYVLSDFTRSIHPAKLLDYLAMGKSVVSTNLPEVEEFNRGHNHIVAVAESHESFVGQIEKSLKQDTESLRAERIRLVEQHAWDRKIEAMKVLIQAKLEKNAETRELNWQGAFARLYRSSSRQVMAAVAICVLGYLLVFHTPLVWRLAEPLRVLDQPIQADVIVVFAGGIGEAGIPSNAYEEKVKQAVELYSQGYAGSIIFSSGVTRIFNEAEVMKAMAVSLGVPAEAILLDEQGGGNYSSVLTMKGIAQSRGWTRMLLVTSLYNGIRSRLVIEKNFPGAAVRITSGVKSAFFGDQRRVAWRHVQAIIHEYLALAYYWWKGYI